MDPNTHYFITLTNKGRDLSGLGRWCLVEAPLGAKRDGFYSDIFLGPTAGLAQSGEKLKFC